MEGNVACAEGALAAGCRFFAFYPITPAREIGQVMALKMPKVGGISIQMEDEIASISSVIGASWAGLKSMTATTT
ncbi:MAG: 2-oxoacid:acceptor oxidoreductase subunit alpha, partial [Candidatus Freyarchaeota archaeon]|nr:2-oxoacid:acceptor oxidoreductase subunit alpha [Candidatus Jordarchaeia archaeon]